MVSLKTVRYLMAVVAVSLLPGCVPQNPTAAQKPAAQPTPVQTVAVMQKEVLRTTFQPASVMAYYRAEVRAKASGYVKSVEADIGDLVKEGDVLAVIDVPELQKQRAILESQIVRRQSLEKRAQAGIALAEA
ncbi:efflux RND transporter periplasmic adaptor subunit [Lignipirellula cremea]|uniref:biotin/lipoyl-binding protein n=1 Tax=Lignipirellula cremea TaxID=2528010 RepID=UPI0018D26135|nr:biotin/lipoyl-binding protein [Lignipirellula cremea]